MYTTASLQEGAIYDHISARGGLYTRQHFCKRGLYTRPHFCKRGLYTSPRGARNLDAVVGERRDLLHARHHHVLHLQAVAFGSLVSNGWFRMVGFEWLLSSGWFRANCAFQHQTHFRNGNLLDTRVETQVSERERCSWCPVRSASAPRLAS